MKDEGKVIFLAEELVKGKLVIRAANKREWTLLRPQLSEAIADPRLFVAIYNGKMVGATFVGRKPGKKEGIIENVEILVKGFEGGGIGSKLLGKAHAYLRRKKIESSTTMAIRGKEGFYEKCGYEIVKKIGPAGRPFCSVMLRARAKKQAKKFRRKHK